MNKSILKQLDSFEKQVDKTHNELNKTIRCEDEET